MKILFIENRGKSILWQLVASQLSNRGHQIAWLVQNPQFAPLAFAEDTNVHVLPFPDHTSNTQAHSKGTWVNENFPALVGDRGRKYFDAGDAHYLHYAQEINQVIEQEQPALVVGESTLFHELIAIDLCRVKKIAYAHPCANRYPSGRFSIFSSDTQHPLIGSGEAWSTEKAKALAQLIATGGEIPFYMRAPKSLEKLARQLRIAKARALVWRARMSGERYNTPSMVAKLRLEYTLRKNLRRWQSLQKKPSDSSRTLLYPLQMQPEANIDVWGRPFSNQVAVIAKMLASTPNEVQVAVKANPKSKYEVSSELLEFAAHEPRLCLLPLEMSMAQAQQCTVGCLTVSGTVGFEAIFGKGRCISLRHPLIESHFPSFHATSIEEGVDRLLQDARSGVGSTESGAKLVQLMVENSFPGLVSEPLYHPQCIEQDNILLIAAALDKFALSLDAVCTLK